MLRHTASVQATDELTGFLVVPLSHNTVSRRGGFADPTRLVAVHDNAAAIVDELIEQLRGLHARAARAALGTGEPIAAR